MESPKIECNQTFPHTIVFVLPCVIFDFFCSVLLKLLPWLLSVTVETRKVFSNLVDIYSTRRKRKPFKISYSRENYLFLVIFVDFCEIFHQSDWCSCSAVAANNDLTR